MGFQVVVNCCWWYDDYSIMGTDAEYHLQRVVQLHDGARRSAEEEHAAWSTFVSGLGMIYQKDEGTNLFWPQFPHAIAALGLHLHRSHYAIRASMLGFFMLMLLSTYGLTSALHDRSSGLIATFLLAQYPIIFEASRQFGPDFPLTAMTVTACFTFLKAMTSGKLGWSLGAGVAFGLGLLCKGQILFFTLPFVVLVLWHLPGVVRQRRWPSLFTRILVIATVAGSIAAPWWYDALSQVPRQISEHLGTTPHLCYSEGGDGSPYSLASLSWYTLALFHTGMSLPFAALLLGMLPSYVRSPSRMKGAMAGAVLVPWLLFSVVFTIKQARYLMPIVPFLASITGVGLSRILSWNRISIVVGSMGIFFALLQHSLITWGGDSKFMGLLDSSAISRYQYSHRYTVPRHSDSHDWVGRTIALVDSVVQGKDRYRILLLNLDNTSNIMCDNVLIYWLTLEDPRLEFVPVLHEVRRTLAVLDDYDLLLVATHHPELLPLRAATIVENLKAHLHALEGEGLFPDAALEAFLRSIPSSHQTLGVIEHGHRVFSRYQSLHFFRPLPTKS